MDLTKEVSKEKPWPSERLKNYCSRARKKKSQEGLADRKLKKIGLDFWGFCCCLLFQIHLRSNKVTSITEKSLLQETDPWTKSATGNISKRKQT